MDTKKQHLLVAVGSRHDQVCSIGAFARTEAANLKEYFASVTLLEPDSAGIYPLPSRVTQKPDIIFFHAPSLYDRKRPWNVLLSALKIYSRHPRAKFITIVHEFTEAPLHWKARQIALAKFSTGQITNTEQDYKGVSGFNANTLRSRLGPTLFMKDLLSAQILADRRSKYRSELSEKYLIDASKKWVLHPGLVTPGKGVDSLDKITSAIGSDACLIVMGGTGPKLRDKIFARQVVDGLTAKLGSRFKLIDSPDDLIFSKMLLASDLVVLPYDAGLSERRSSFLSAMSCGANVWATVGKMSEPMDLSKSGAHQFEAAKWNSGDPSMLDSIKAALEQSENPELRMKNLAWSENYSWDNRGKQVSAFLSKL